MSRATAPERRAGARHGAVQGAALVALRLVAAVMLAAGLAALPIVLGRSAPAAFAASNDRIDSFTQVYELDSSGVLHVTETIVYRFGSDSGRHGIMRTFVTREKYDDDNDAVYTYKIDSVKSPSGAATQYTTDTDTDGRTGTMTLKIGDPNRTISSPTATYVLTYTITGAMRHFADYDELYWDAVGTGWQADMDKVSITVTVPGGAQGLTCFAGPVGTKNPCTKAPDPDGGKVTIEQNGVDAGDALSFGVKITSGLVSDNKPHLEPRERNYALPIGAGLFGVTTIGSIVGGIAYWRKRGRDMRYVGLPPGTVPTEGSTAKVGYDTGDVEIPVRFTPPRIPVAEAGLLIDGQVDHRETAATLIDLAVRGALRLHNDGDEENVRVELLDPSKATAPHEVVLLTELFSGGPPGTSVNLGDRGSLTDAHDELVDAVRGQVTKRGWFRKVPSTTKLAGVGVGAIGCLAFVGFGAAPLLLFAVPLLPIIVAVLILHSKLRRGQRTADGRAVCDEVEGFRTYLATAEADQLQFEEGEDIFSRYLPWAMIFELTDRWTKICRDLIAMGRIPDVQPYWYVGSFRLSTFNTALLFSTLNTSATPVSTSGSSGTGFGGGSSFGGGGFSGGGGGGGGGGSW